MRNCVRLIGHLGADPEVKNLDNEKKVAKFSIATSESYQDDQGNKVTDTQWHQIVAWGKQAEIVEKYLKKGSEVALEGKLLTRSYTDKEGIKRYVTEIMCSEIVMLGRKPTEEEKKPKKNGKQRTAKA